ncbi:hypothetical protein Q31a_45600 [Aureliella helgolandensis]|uniref:Uncharacterized protein n=1 Tax=Aureliella helgolandensis TaxID=2527968 RepID=A0A518GC70_9BACT|nr:hypothetical protein Q31a_45600 [Aureliella helgolandensis]
MQRPNLETEGALRWNPRKFDFSAATEAAPSRPTAKHLDEKASRCTIGYRISNSLLEQEKGVPLQGNQEHHLLMKTKLALESIGRCARHRRLPHPPDWEC